MKKTRLCALLGIEYPIIQGGMTWIANAELAAAVSNAGGLGLISPNAGMALDGNPVENLRSQIKKAKRLTNKPFGVNFPLQDPQVKAEIDVAIEEKIPVVTTSAGNPATYTSYLKEAGIKVLHLVASVRHARGAEGRGVDAVIAEGYEAGGHNGLDELPTFVLVPQVVDAVSIPVVAAGGIADARGFVAALALGAEGVQMGTRFVATHECIAHQKVKEAIVNAIDTGTVISGRKLGPTRGLKNELTEKILEMESRGASAEELQAFIGPGRARLGKLEGNMAEGEAYCGAIAGLIKEIVSAGEVVRSIMENADAVLASLK
jgi:enoyl-[acyl-carrier protein] reductase II